jgi:hypothetical protein
MEPTIAPAPLAAAVQAEPTVLPAAGTTPVAPVEGEAAPPAATFPPEVMQIPAFQALFAGQPPAVSGSLKEMNKSPEADALRKHKDLLMEAGIGLYRSMSGDTGVIFNQFYISPQQLKDADNAGTLMEIAPSIQEVNQSVATSGDAHPVLTHSGEVPGSFASAPAPTMPTASAAPGPSPSTTGKLATARKQQVLPGSPTSGPRPGGGRVLNSILKQVV